MPIDERGALPEGIDPVTGLPENGPRRDRTIVESVRASLQLLTNKDRRKFMLASAAQMTLSLLDLAGVALIGAIGAVAVSGFSPTSLPGPVQDLRDSTGLTASQLIGVLAASAVVLLVTKTVLSAFITRKMFRFLAYRQADVAARLARSLLARPLLEVQRWSTSEVLYALTGGVAAAVTNLLGAALIIVTEVALFVLIGVGLLIVDPLLTISAAVYFVIIVVILQVLLGRASARNAAIQAERGMSTITTISEALTTYRETTVLDRRAFYVDRFNTLTKQGAHAGSTNAFLAEIPKYVLETALVIGAFLLAIIQFLTKDLAAAAATVALFLAAGFRIVPALLRLQGAGITIRSAAAAARKTFELAFFFGLTDGQAPRALSPQEALRIRERLAAGHPEFQGSVQVESVTVTYPGAPEPALQAVDMQLAPGKSVALVGATGAGKSTLADVILGVVSPDEGAVFVDGLDPREAIHRWPGAIAYVPQAVGLADGTIRDNVALGLPREAIDDEMAWEALERAHLARFLRERREGLDTLVGERGVRLSGGQRQRLGIARALYSRPRLLVLDEATSALDAETEMAITATLRELEGEVSTITIAHRLATIRFADEVIFLRRGAVEARGSFDEVRSAVPDFDRQAQLLGL